MNNELIERLDKEIALWATDCDAITLNAISMRELSNLFRDCKAALTEQQQEAEPVDWSAFPAYLIDHYEGKIIYEETLQEALCDMLKDPKYHSPKPAAQPQVPEGIVEKYNELLYHVARKFPNESRHETALRYIKNAESAESYCAAAKEEGK